MKLEKNKIVFASLLAVVFIFLITYSIKIMEEDEKENENLEQTLIPELEPNPKVYESKLDAINDLKEVRETKAPSIYDEKLIDSLGFYRSDLPEMEKERIVDSIYASGKMSYSERSYEAVGKKRTAPSRVLRLDSGELKRKEAIAAKELGLEHQLFFAAAPKQSEESVSASTDPIMYAVVDGDQVVKANSRLRMRLAHDALINNRIAPKNTPIYGFIRFRANRALITIETFQDHPTPLKAFDLQDGSEGIYVENNFRAEAATEVLDDVIGDINIPGVPQVGGMTQVLRRTNRNVKVTILNNYRLVLKPKL